MSWTRVAGVMAGALVVSGCAYGYRSLAVSASYETRNRPDPSYYCYDCHGYRYFDPYYDWCVGHGFRYAWSRHPQVVRIYRERYVALRERHPDFGRYRYKGDYRRSPRYRNPRDYDAWRREQRRREETRDEVSRPRRKPKQGGDQPGDTRKKHRRQQGGTPGDPGSHGWFLEGATS